MCVIANLLPHSNSMRASLKLMPASRRCEICGWRLSSFFFENTIAVWQLSFRIVRSELLVYKHDCVVSDDVIVVILVTPLELCYDNIVVSMTPV